MMHRHKAKYQSPSSPRCLVTLEPLNEEGFSAKGQRDLTGGRDVIPSRIDLIRSDIVGHRLENMKHLSISGMQDKISLRLERGNFSAVAQGGTHILKPIPGIKFQLAEDLPANEHTTMLIAKYLGINTAACGLIRMGDDELAYLTRRFDHLPNGTRAFQEDFGSLAQISEATNGKDWKYNFSYEKMGELIKTHSFSRQRDLEEFYRRVAFCFIIGNGDAHIRNFSLLRMPNGSTTLSPAYDLVCTPVHLPHDNDLGLSLLEKEREGTFSPSYNALGYYTRADFVALGNALGLLGKVTHSILDNLTSEKSNNTIHDIIDRSYLTDQAKESYRQTVSDRSRKFAQEYKS